MHDNMQISTSVLPAGNSIVFEDSSFFRGGRASRKLPSPDEVRKTGSQGRDRNRPAPVLFPSLGLVVKYGRAITIAEGQCLWAVRKLIGQVVPVPEIYGWQTDGDDTFIYMELIQGDTLEQRWDTLTKEEREDICHQLRRMVDSWRELRQDPADSFIGRLIRTCSGNMAFLHLYLRILIMQYRSCKTPPPSGCDLYKQLLPSCGSLHRYIIFPRLVRACQTP
jgi:hypothetical protein